SAARPASGTPSGHPPPETYRHKRRSPGTHWGGVGTPVVRTPAGATAAPAARGSGAGRRDPPRLSNAGSRAAGLPLESTPSVGPSSFIIQQRLIVPFGLIRRIRPTGASGQRAQEAHHVYGRKRRIRRLALAGHSRRLAL